MAIIIEWPIPPTFWAKNAAKQPKPPPAIVPIPRFKPFPSVAPDRITFHFCQQIIINFLVYFQGINYFLAVIN